MEGGGRGAVHILFYLYSTKCEHYPDGVQIMMLKLKGHPPVMMRRTDGDQLPPFSGTFSKVCAHSLASYLSGGT